LVLRVTVHSAAHQTRLVPLPIRATRQQMPMHNMQMVAPQIHDVRVPCSREVRHDSGKQRLISY
jgi:hypothetical protein